MKKTLKIMSTRKTLLFIFVINIIYFGQVLAATPSNVTTAQIDLFKQMSPSEQQALLKQFGKNPATLANTISTDNEEYTDSEIVERKSTMTDEELDETELTDEENKLVSFGYDLFAGEPLTISPLNNLPVPADYLLASGDEINVQLYGKENQRYNFIINREGEIEFDTLGPVNVAGLNFRELRTKIKAYVAKRMIGIEVNVTMGKLRTMQILVLGEAYKSGAYVLSSLSTITQTLKAAGGIKETGSLRNIQIKRKNKVIGHIDLYDWLIKGNTSDDFRLHNGDVIFIPTKGIEVSITGEVRRPAIYELAPKTSLLKALKIAGGIKHKSASKNNILLQRSTDEGFQVIITSLKEQRKKAIYAKTGDKISIRAKPEHFTNEVTILGNVTHPGLFQWYQGMRVSDLIKNKATDLLPFTDLKYALIFRDTPKRALLKFKLSAVLEDTQSEQNLVLEKHDKIIIFDLASETIRYGLPALIIGQLNQYLTAEQLSLQLLELNDQEQQELEEQKEQKELLKKKSVTDLEKLKAEAREKINYLQVMLKEAIAKKQYPYVNIEGDVKFPGHHPLPENATVLDVLDIAGGLKDSAYTLKVEISRYNKLANQKTELIHEQVNLEKILKGDMTENIKINNRDTMHIFRSPAWLERYSINVSGEVEFPGTYIVKRGETLASIIKRAGGVTSFAYPKGAIFSRELLREKEMINLAMIRKRLEQEVANMTFKKQSSTNPLSSADPTKAMDIIEKLSEAKPLGRMVINLDQILVGNDEQNIIIENNDELFIPALSKVVSVMGQVQVPSAFIFDTSLSSDDYINLAGGSLQQADEGRIYVIRANGSVMLPNNSAWFSRNEKVLEMGDTIIVPVDTNYSDPLDILTSGTQILYQLGVAYSAINR
jgi:protein involved in polysaccharide export with SLBB domain